MRLISSHLHHKHLNMAYLWRYASLTMCCNTCLQCINWEGARRDERFIDFISSQTIGFCCNFWRRMCTVSMAFVFDLMMILIRWDIETVAVACSSQSRVYGQCLLRGRRRLRSFTGIFPTNSWWFVEPGPRQQCFYNSVQRPFEISTFLYWHSSDKHWSGRDKVTVHADLYYVHVVSASLLLWSRQWSMQLNSFIAGKILLIP